jgi:membrane associated rhomboid family serine protease
MGGKNVSTDIDFVSILAHRKLFKLNATVEESIDGGNDDDPSIESTSANDEGSIDDPTLDARHLTDVAAASDNDHGDRLEQQQDSEHSSSPSQSLSIADTDLGVIEGLRDVLSRDADPGGRLHHVDDPKVAYWIKLFQFAQSERRIRKGTVRPYGIIGMFSNVSDIRSDLKWAQDAAYRREHGSPYISWEDFYDKETKGRVYPFFTYTFMTASVALMVIAFHKNDWKVEEMKVNPMVGPSSEVLLELGALEGRLMIENSQWWRLLSPMFLHAGIIHLLLNMTVMLLLSHTVERNHGFLLTTFLFFLSGVCANILSALMQPGYVLVGASGGIFGLVGLCVADITLNWKLLFLVLQSRRTDDPPSRCDKCLCFWILALDLLINSLVGFTPYVDNFAHMGGLVYGFLMSCAMLERLPLSFLGATSSLCHRFRINALRFAGAILSLSLILLSIILLSRSDGQTTPCPRCRYISCIPFPFWTENKWWYCDDCSTVSGKGYKRVRDDYYSEIDIDCPSGYTVTVDVFDEQFVSTAEISSRLSDYCRAEC